MGHLYVEVTPEGLQGLQDEDWSGDESDAAKAVAAAWTGIIEIARDRNGTKGNLLRLAMAIEIGAIALVLLAVSYILGVT